MGTIGTASAAGAIPAGRPDAGCQSDQRCAIESYALLGDTRTAALTSPDGAVEWLCAPRFDGEPVFAALVAGRAGGLFRIRPAHPTGPATRRYLHDTTTVETVWPTAGGAVVLLEGMVSEIGDALLPGSLLVRRVEVRGADADVEVTFDPKFGWENAPPATRAGAGGVVVTHGSTAMALTWNGTVDVQVGKTCIVKVGEDRPLVAALAISHREPVVAVDPEHGWTLLDEDAALWQQWSRQLDVARVGDLRDAVVRSLITLRLLTYSPSGAPVAAATTSLPEQLGGGRNWDYRYAWPRDASIGAAAFLAAGRAQEAEQFLGWLLHASRLTRPRLPPLLTLMGTPVPAERELEGWPGYGGSRPVRVGNEASEQHQLDVYGWVVDAAWVLSGAVAINGELWRTIAGFADYVARNWQRPDAGIWEARDEPRHYTHSKLMAWLVLDRAGRMAAKRRVRSSRRRHWENEASKLRREILTSGIDHERGVYVRSFGERAMDAALLLLPLIQFEDPASPRVAATVEAVERELGCGPYVYRYTPGSDGLEGGEGAFLPCSFWLVQALAKTGQLARARHKLQHLVDCAGPLGLFAEEVDPGSGSHLGNYPQAFSHAAFVQAAFALADSPEDPPVALPGPRG